MSVRRTGGHLVVDVLVSLGVDRVFGVVGGQTLAISDAILATPGIELVHTRHENAAAVMADAHGRLTGRPAACLATTGPGATNLLTGVGGALRDSSPMFVLTCNNNAENVHKDDAQNLDHVAVFSPLTKLSRFVAHATSLQQAMEEAYVAAVTGNPGPVHLDFARDLLEGDLPPDLRPVSESHPLLSWTSRRPRANRESMQAAADLVLGADRPVIWVGNGVGRSRAGDSVLALAEELDAPVVTTFNGIGAVPSSHPLVFGPVSRMGTSLSNRVLGDADLVLALGNSLNAVSTARWRRRLPSVVQVDIDPATIGRYYADVTTGVVADVDQFVRDLLEEARGGGDRRVSRASWLHDLRAAEKDWWAQSVPGPSASGSAPEPGHVVRALREVAPDDTLLIPDAGNPGVWSFLWDTRAIGSYIKPVGFGNMGFALPAAISAGLVDPTRPVLALVGDGSLGMSLGELETLARVGGPICVVVMNDASYGNIRQEQELHFEGRTIGVDFEPVDFAAVARGMGVHASRVDDLADLRRRAAQALDGDRPVLLDVPIDRSVSAWTYPAFVAQPA